MSLGDQPEGRSGNCLLAGNANSHAQWQFACDHSKIRNVLPACKDCFNLMQMADTAGDSPDWLSTHCQMCTNWMLCNLDDKRLSYKSRDNYPDGYLLGGTPTEDRDGMINPIILSYSVLNHIVTLCHEKTSNGQCKPAIASAFLSENGIHSKYQKVIIKHASNLWQN